MIARLRYRYLWYQHFLAAHPRLVTGIIGGLFVLTFAVMLWRNISLTPDRVTLVLFVAALLLGQGLRFLRDWLPFVLVLFAYEGLRGFADGTVSVNITNVIAAERWLVHSSTIPTIWLQTHLYHPGSLQWYDYLATLFYFLHFPLPLVFAFILWWRDRRDYWLFITSLIILCFSGFITYVLFPAAPPWLASREGFLPPVTKIIDVVLGIFPTSMSVSYLYHHLNPNQVAAMPSLHAAFPWLVFLTFWHLRGRWALLFLPYCLGLWWSIIYLGEHYAVDALAGIIYAQVAFWLGLRMMQQGGWLQRRLQILQLKGFPRSSGDKAETQPIA